MPSRIEMVAAVSDGVVLGACVKTPEGYQYVSWTPGKRSSRKPSASPLESLPKGLRKEITDMMVMNVRSELIPFQEFIDKSNAGALAGDDTTKETEAAK